MRLTVLRSCAFLGLILLPASSRADAIGTLHCNDARGVPTRNGQTVTISGVVTAVFSTPRNARLFVQDATGGINVFGTPTQCALMGDSVQVTGVVSAYNGLTEVTGSDSTALSIQTVGHGHVPAPLPVTGVEFRAERPDNCEPNESRLVALAGVTIRAANGAAVPDTAQFRDGTTYMLTPVGQDSTTSVVAMRVLSAPGCPGARSLVGHPIPKGPLTVVGILSQYLARGAARGGYQLVPRTPEDLRPQKGSAAH